MPGHAALSAEPPLTPNPRDSSPLVSLIRRTSSRRVKNEHPTLAQLTPPRPSGSPGIAQPPPSPILHTQFRNSTVSANTTSVYDDGASMRTLSWDARSTAPHRAVGHDSLASSNYDLESITNRYRDTWRSSGLVDPPSAYDVPDVPDLPTVVVSAAPETPPTQPWQPEGPYEVPGPTKGGRTPTRVQHPTLNFSRPVIQPVSEMHWDESEERKRDVLMRNARSQSPTTPGQASYPASSRGPSPLGFQPSASPSSPAFRPPTGSRPVSPASIHSQNGALSPRSPVTPVPSGAQSPALSPALQSPSTGGLTPRITSSSSVYSNYSFYELPTSPTSPTGQPSSPGPYPPTPMSAPAGVPNISITPATPAQRPRAKSSASRHKGEDANLIAQPQTPQDYLQAGIKYHLDNKLAESAAAFEKSATLDGGCGVGMLMWGLAQRHGWGCTKDEATGFKWLRRAAELAVTDLEKEKHGDMSAVKSELVLAIYEVGQSFFRGWGVPKDKEMAVQYYRVAARLGDPDAQQELAFCLLNGKGCKKDKKEAARWYRAAVQQGVSDIGLAWIYKDKYQ